MLYNKGSNHILMIIFVMILLLESVYATTWTTPSEVFSDFDWGSDTSSSTYGGIDFTYGSSDHLIGYIKPVTGSTYATKLLIGVSSTSSISNLLVLDGNTSYVGIGTISPVGKLNVNGSINISGSGGQLIFPDGTTLSSNSSIGGSETDPLWTGNQSLYVPYTGATSNVDLGSYNLTTTGVLTGAAVDTGNGLMEINSIAAYLGDQNLRTTDSPTFATTKFTTLSDGYLPYHISDASGLANTGIYWDNGNSRVGIGTASPVGKLDVTGHTLLYQAGDEGANRTAPSDTDPHLRVYSSDETQANDYIEMYHSQATGFITVGTGSMRLTTPGEVDFYTGGQTTNIFKFAAAANIRNFYIHEAFTIRAQLADEQLTFALHDSIGNQLILTNYENSAFKNHDHAVQTDPTLYIHSDTDPDDDNTEWMSMAYINATDYARVETGKGDLALMPAGNVGVGTASPGKKLEINGTSGGFSFDTEVSPLVMNTTAGNVTITSAGGSVIIKLG